MRKFINRKWYNTETARWLGVVESGIRSDLDYWSEELYQRPDGEYFLYCEGRPLSPYSCRNENHDFCGLEKIVPIADERAFKWAKRNLNEDEFNKLFGEGE